MEALYSQSHPTYKAYLYLLAPISLVILNPIGFTLMEIGKRGMSGDVAAEVRANNGGRDKLVLAGTIAKNIVLNPVVLMTALGIIGNLVFKHNLPVSIAGVLNVSTFSGCDSKLQNSYWRHDNVCPSKASFNLSISPVLYQSRVDHWIGD